MKKALVLNGKVVQVADATFEVHNSMKWIDCPDDCTAGWLYERGQLLHWDQRTPEEIADDDLKYLRMQRNKRLRKTDVWALADKEMTEAQKEYRQALRDITDRYKNINEVVWPAIPE